MSQPPRYRDPCSHCHSISGCSSQGQRQPVYQTSLVHLGREDSQNRFLETTFRQTASGHGGPYRAASNHRVFSLQTSCGSVTILTTFCNKTCFPPMKDRGHWCDSPQKAGEPVPLLLFVQSLPQRGGQEPFLWVVGRLRLHSWNVAIFLGMSWSLPASECIHPTVWRQPLVWQVKYGRNSPTECLPKCCLGRTGLTGPLSGVIVI